MILTKNLDIKIINHNYNHYSSLGYNIKYGDIINIPIEHLTCGSHYKIDVKCNFCNNINNIKYQDYIKITTNNKLYYCSVCVKDKKTKYTLLKKYGVDNISKSEIFKNKKIETNIKNWGVKNVFQSEKIKLKSNETCIRKYGFKYSIQNNDIKLKSKLTRIKNGNQTLIEEISEFKIYRKKVRSLTNKIKKKLFNNWNGYDYYDGEYIKDYFNLNSNDKKYPTIDHKISIFNGFKENINYDIISNINNLCITKRKINSSKNKK